MSKITKITKEQQAQFAAWTKKWIEIGLSTEPANFDAATEAALRGYAYANLGKPMVVLRMASPYAATLGGAMAVGLLAELKGLKPQVGSQVWSQVGSQVWEAVNNYGCNSLWASWAAYVSFFRDVMGWDDPILEKFNVDETLVKSCGWTWWHENVLAISDRPKAIRLDAAGRLHGETGPSIEYRDGWALYHWHGVSIPAEWATGKKPTAHEALTWPNIEQRRAACELVGWHNIMNQLKPVVIDADGDEEIGTLLEVDLPDSGRERFLKVLCGTKREFCLPVPKEMKTAIQANAWTYGLDPKDFQPEVRT